MMKKDSKQVGDAGEYFVAYNLARRGINSALMSPGAKSVDLLATVDGSVVISLQVKASWGRTDPRQWIVGSHKPHPSPTFYFVFCNIWEDISKDPEVFIVPSQLVYDSVKWESSVPLFKITREIEKQSEGKWELITDHFSK
jgi:hypothetical protein